MSDIALIVIVAAAIIGAVVLMRRSHPAGDLRSLEARMDSAAQRMAQVVTVLEERRVLEERVSEAVTKVERLIAGSYSRGQTGENLLAAALAEFPPEMLVRDFRVGGRVCEFALRTADGKLLPVDSKWPAWDMIETLTKLENADERENLRRRVEKEVVSRLREVAGYIDPSLTVPVAVVAVPDAAYACCRKAHAEAQRARVVIVSYSLALPFLLAFWNLHRTYSRDLDVEDLLARINDVSVCLGEMGDRIEGQLSRALTMATNATAEMRSLVGRARTSISMVSAKAEAEAAADR